ncbi:hypothetical protein I6N95_00525 [Vagococcus sp. BWB3-3]|uniref:Recombinase family protein n=1 Tax=Vagococcus allomyrinae TaxID=2794353 RepID=A0A940STB1_9ENTE|nr:hypothetical protein [Vagococcus allomyrinae]MBP1039479.1 hypothetical protein [Vagococcus allomyrinae]
MGKKILGYVQQEANKKEMMGKSDFLFKPTKGLSKIANLQEFAAKSDEFILLTHSLDDLNLQLIQFFPILEALKDRDHVIRFVEQGLAEPLPHEVYFEILVELASSEKRTMQRRYEKSKIQAQAKGKTFGRPVIDERTIKQIQSLYMVERRSIREISQKCEVSVGTVHKYIKEVR